MLNCLRVAYMPLQWLHNGRDGVSNHQPHDCLLNRLSGRRSKKIAKLRVTGLCAGNLPGTGEFPTQRASNAENGSIWWRHHGSIRCATNSQRSVTQHHARLHLWVYLPVCKGRAMFNYFADTQMHDGVMTWKPILYYWPLRRIHR